MSRKGISNIKNIKHGMASKGKIHPLYRVWASMKSRCYNKKYHNYSDYGGRGIIICDAWINNYEIFHNWAIENGYKKGLSLDRENNNGNYEPSNCRWVTNKIQSRNRRSNHFITAFGETKHFEDWVIDNRCVVKRPTLFNRLKRLGLSPENALTLPPQPRMAFNSFSK